MMDRRNLLTSSFIALGLGAAGAISAAPASADQVFADDVIVQGSLCVGLDCVNNENFGFDTIKLKENNTRIKFEDTSVGSFPSTDWQLTANDSASGGANKFSIDDVTDGKTPFTITGNAPSNSIFVDSGGRVGLKTATPSVELHLRDGDSPTVRLEQDGSSGFAPQTWDLAGNETNFFIRDVTGGSRLPFRIQPGAPTNAIYVASNGNVGMGAGTTPGAGVDVVTSNLIGLRVAGTGNKQSLVQSTDNGAVQLRLQSDNTNRRIIAVNSANVQQSQIELGTGSILLAGPTVSGADLWATISAAGIVTRGPTCNPGPCDGVFDKSSYTIEPIEVHADYMWKNRHLLDVGPTGPDLPFNVTQKTAGILTELEKAHIYIEQLNHRLNKLEQTNAN